MSRLTRTRALGLAGAAALAGALAGCGKVGELQRPAPLFGRAPAGAAQAQAQPAQDASSPVRTIDPRSEFLNPAPSRSVEIPGQSPDPIAPGPQGALPDPYANPR
jgi:hypothetical protein